MPTFNLSSVNIWAILVAAFATFMLGGLWYTAVFGKVWVKLHGYTPEQVQAMKERRPPPVFFGVMIVAYLLLSTVMAVIFNALGVTSAAGGAFAGFLIWLGPAAAIKMTDHIASPDPMGIFWIDSSYQLVYLVMIGAILGAWR